MDREIINLWEKNKDRLREYISKTEQKEYDEYEELVKLIVEYILKPDDWNVEKIKVIGNDDYHGLQVFLMPEKTYEPSKYLMTYTNYGSCSGCDTLLKISDYDDGLPSEQQVSDYMTLLLHLVQNMQIIGESEEFV